MKIIVFLTFEAAGKILGRFRIDRPQGIIGEGLTCWLPGEIVAGLSYDEVASKCPGPIEIDDDLL
jgi:hypothetical protein